MLKPKRKFFTVVIILSLVVFPLLVSARGLVPCGGYLANGTPEPRCNVTDFFVLAARVTNFLIATGGIIAVLLIIYSGFMLVISAGNEEVYKQRKQAITNAVVGFVLTLMAFVIVNTVVNTLLLSKCKVDLANALTYITIDPSSTNCSQAK